MYFYHGYALGVASTIPKNEFTKACSALSPCGGKASDHSDSFSDCGISFKSVDTEVSGWREDTNGLTSWNTKASVIIQGLNIQDMVKADRIEARIYSEFHAGQYEATTTVRESKFEGLKIAGKPAQVEISDDLSLRYSTYSSMQAAYANCFSHDGVLACVEGCCLTAGDLASPDLCGAPDVSDAFESYQQQKALPSLKSAVLCSFVKKITIQDGGNIKTWGPIVGVPNFGNIYLGELIVWPWMRCLTMFRVELARNGGSISGGSAGVNGTTQPPGTHPTTTTTG